MVNLYWIVSVVVALLAAFFVRRRAIKKYRLTEQTISSLNAKLLEQVDELEEASRSKDQFLAILGHELRNPLSPVKNALFLIRRNQHDQSMLEEAYDIIDRQVAHMTVMIDDLLDIARITSGKIVLRKAHFNLNDTVERVVQAVTPQMDRKFHRIRVHLHPTAVYVDADIARVEQIITNLLVNACKYTEPCGVISVSTDIDHNVAVFSVKDTGIGVIKEMQNKIFEIFTQAVRAVPLAEGGLGLGLALVKKLVLMHHGSIHVKSEGTNKGSEFAVRLPLSKGVAPEPELKKLDYNFSTNILIVDDNEDAADSLSMALSSQGHHVVVAYDGQAGLQAATDSTYQFILLDIGLPKLNGYDVCRQLREHGCKSYIIAITGFGSEDDKRMAMAAGFDMHLTKPVDPATLNTIIAEKAHATLHI